MLAISYLFEKLNVNQYVYANTELERRLQKARKSGNEERRKKLHNARERLIDKTSAEAWKREPEFMKDQQKDRQARRLRRAAYDKTTRPDLEADLSRKLKQFKRKTKSLASKVGRTLTTPVPSLIRPRVIANVPRF